MYTLLALPLLSLPALAQDVSIHETLATMSSATDVYGGTFTGSGWRIDDSNSRMMWDFGKQVDRGRVSVVIDDITLENLQGDNNHLIELFDSGGHWSCNRAINFRVYGPNGGPGQQGDIKLKAWDNNGNFNEARGGIQDWDGKPHTWTVEWESATATLSRDGVELVAIDVTGIDLRVGTLWLPINDWTGDYSAPIGTTFSDLDVRAWEPGEEEDTGVPDDGDPNTFAPIDDVGVANWEASVYADDDDLPAQGEGGQSVERSYLQYDLSSLSGTVTKAELVVHLRADSHAAGDGGSVFAVSETGWSEDTLTWGSRPALGNSLGAWGAVNSGDSVTIDVTGATSAGGLVAYALVSTGDDGVHFASKEEGDGSGAAMLRVTTVPDDGGGDADADTDADTDADADDKDDGDTDSGGGPWHREAPGGRTHGDLGAGAGECGCAGGAQPGGPVALIAGALGLVLRIRRRRNVSA